jgi:hypothetical protein
LRDEGDGFTGSAGTCCSADAVHVVFRVGGHIVILHVSDSNYIDNLMSAKRSAERRRDSQ